MKNIANTIQNGDLGTAIERKTTSEVVPRIKPVIPDNEYLATTIPVCSLSEWFLKNHLSFTSVKRVALQVSGINANEDLVFSVLNPEGGVDESGVPKRILRVWNKAHEFKVLDIPALDMNVFGTGLKIIYPHENIFLKCYGTKAGLHISFCIKVSNLIIPYAMIKMKKSSEGIKIIKPPTDIAQIEEKLREPGDVEDLILQYKQALKFGADFTDNSSIISYLIDKQNTSFDVYHWELIDSVILWTLFKKRKVGSK